jgi:hypothetical protein
VAEAWDREWKRLELECRVPSRQKKNTDREREYFRTFYHRVRKKDGIQPVCRTTEIMNYENIFLVGIYGLSQGRGKDAVKA